MLAGLRWRRGDRTAARLHAYLAGYFWLPCPNCGRMFGGQELATGTGHSTSIPKPDGSGTGLAICPSCTALGVGDRAWAVTLDHR